MSDFWQKKWEIGETAFHRERPHPQLVKHFQSEPRGKVMVPLCGKSLDLLWLKDQGHEVVGVELSPIACEDFFKENRLPYQVHQKGEFTVFEGDNISLWCGDFFKTPSEAWSQVTALYDRAALIALPQEIRTRYAQSILENWKRQNLSSANMLLIAIEYPEGAMSGPPFSVPESEVRNLYRTARSIGRVEAVIDDELSERTSRFSGAQVTEKTYLVAMA